MGDNFPMDQRGGSGLGMIQMNCIYCALFLLLFHQLHPRSSGLIPEAGNSVLENLSAKPFFASGPFLQRKVCGYPLWMHSLVCGVARRAKLRRASVRTRTEAARRRNSLPRFVEPLSGASGGHLRHLTEKGS